MPPSHTPPTCPIIIPALTPWRCSLDKMALSSRHDSVECVPDSSVEPTQAQRSEDWSTLQWTWQCKGDWECLACWAQSACRCSFLLAQQPYWAAYHLAVQRASQLLPIHHPTVWVKVHDRNIDTIIVAYCTLVWRVLLKTAPKAPLASGLSPFITRSSSWFFSIFTSTRSAKTWQNYTNNNNIQY